MVGTLFNIFGGYDKTIYPQQSSQALMNLYLVSDQKEKRFSLYPTDGLELAYTMSQVGKGRFITRFKDKLLTVYGNNVYLLEKNFSENRLGTIETDQGLIDLAASAKELLIVDGSSGWLYNDDTGTFTKQQQPAFPTLPNAVVFFGARFIVSFGESNEIGFSETNDATKWDGNEDFALPFGEETRGLATLKGRLYVFGKFLVQKWYDAGSPPPVPFRKEPSDIDIGCAAIRSVAVGEQLLAWLGQTEQGVGSVMLTDGTSVRAISTQAINGEFERYTDVSDATGFIYKNSLGHIFYQINFTKANKSWQFHINSDAPLHERWTELTYAGSNRHLAEQHTYFNEDHYVVDYRNNRLYRRSNLVYSDAGDPIKRLLISPTLRLSSGDRFVVNYFRIWLNSGDSANCYDYSAPFNGDKDAELVLSLSRDGARTFTKDLPRKIGKKGDYLKRVEWWNLGYSDQFTFKLEFWNSIPFVALEALIDIKR